MPVAAHPRAWDLGRVPASAPERDPAGANILSGNAVFRPE